MFAQFLDGFISHPALPEDDQSGVDYGVVVADIFQLPRPNLDESVESQTKAEPREASRLSKKMVATPRPVTELRREHSKKTALVAPVPSRPSPTPRRVLVEEDSEEIRSEDLSLTLEECVMRKAGDNDHTKDLEEARAASSSTPSMSVSAAVSPLKRSRVPQC